MAELVLGVAKTLVDGTITRTVAKINEESRLRRMVERDLEFIVGEFQMMQSFLDGTTEEHIRDNVARTWVSQVRNLAYNVEDGIESIEQLDTEKPDWFYRWIPSCMRGPLPLDVAADIMDTLKARVQNVSHRNERYRLIGDPGQKPVIEVAQMTSPGALEKQAIARDTPWRQDLEALTKLITREGSDELQVISVWAPEGGPRAASIVREACDNPEIWVSFTYRACVKLTHDFNLHKFFRSVLDQFYANSHEEQQGAVLSADFQEGEPAPDAGVSPVQEFRQQVTNQRYLIVLEDVTSRAVWAAIRKYLPVSGSGSRIVISTQCFEVACFCTGLPCFQRFSTVHSLCVFFKEDPQIDEGRNKVTKRAPVTGQSSDFALIGRESETKELSDCLDLAKTCEMAYQVMSVWGIAGAGKTFLVRDLYLKELQGTRFDKHGWVDVSHPFDLWDFCLSLLLRFQSHSLEANKYLHSGDTGIRYPIEECRDLLKHHQCLVVIDNLKSTEDWDLIQDALAVKHSRSIIIVVTNEESIALHCADKKELVFNLKALEAREATNLFILEMRKNPRFHEEYIDIQYPELHEVISKCGGLPKVIVATANCFAGRIRLLRETRMLNNHFLYSLETSPEFSGLRDLFDRIGSYFRRSCPNFLKLCILYLPIFPECLCIRRRRLVMRWVAEGYAKDSASDTAEENGEEMISKITELSIIEPLETKIPKAVRMIYCQVNRFFHEYISRHLEANFTFASEVFALNYYYRETNATTGCLLPRHLVIEPSWDRDRFLFENMRIDFSRLRSLTVFGEWMRFFISERMKVLRVLDLENASGVRNEDLKRMLKLLTRLKYLSLRECSDISCLPNSVGELRQLQTLDVRYTNIVKMPASIRKLEKLQYIRAGTITLPEDPSTPSNTMSELSDLQRYFQPVGVKVASRVCHLTKLHTLGVVNAGGAGGKRFLKSLRFLTKLRKLGVSGISKKNSKELGFAVRCLEHLESLSVWLDKNNQGFLDDMLPNERLINLQSLKLYGPVERLPLRITNVLHNLRKLNLEMDKISEDDIRVLGDLKELCILRLRIMKHENVELNFCVTADCYENMKVLEIASSSSLVVSFESGDHRSRAMKKLELLKVGCYSTGSQLRGLSHLRELKYVHLICPQDDGLKVHLEGQFPRGTRRPVLKLSEVNPLAQPWYKFPLFTCNSISDFDESPRVFLNLTL